MSEAEKHSTPRSARFGLRTLFGVAAVVGLTIFLAQHLCIKLDWNQYFGYGDTNYISKNSRLDVSWLSSDKETYLLNWGTEVMGHKSWRLRVLWWGYNSHDGFSIEGNIQYWLSHRAPGSKTVFVEVIPKDSN